MTAEPDLLPCPWCGGKLASVSVSEGSTFRWRKVDGCCADGPEIRHDTMAEDQAAAEAESRAKAIAAWNTRANVAHATAAKDAELVELRSTIEALRAEVERLRALAGCAYQMAGMHDAPLVWLDRLSEAANGDALPDADTLMDELLPYQPDVVCESEARAERLAEALRDAQKSLRTIANLAGGTEYLMTIGDVRGYANSRANAARVALAQEDRNG